MLSLQQRDAFSEIILPQRIGRKVTAAHFMSLVLIALLAFASYLTLQRAIGMQRQTARAIEATEHQRMLSQRIASLAAQFALGNSAVRHDLRSAIDDFEQTHWGLVSGSGIGIASAISDLPLKQLYFEGSAPLDAAATEYVAQARRIAALAPQNAALGAHTAPVFLAAQAPLAEALDGAVRIRRAEADRGLTQLGYAGAAIFVGILGALIGATLGVFRPMARQIVALTRNASELAQQSTVDPVTGMLNRRSFQARGAVEIQKARRYQRPLSLLRIDADQLMAIQSTYGSDGGETILRALTSSIFDGTRTSDLVARVDAEQFAILLPETNCEGAELVAERLRRKISDLRVAVDGESVGCTISVGVAAAEKDASFLWPTLKRADEAVYEAKVRGRNRVVVAAA